MADNSAIIELDSRIDSLESSVSSLQSDLNTMENTVNQVNKSLIEIEEKFGEKVIIVGGNMEILSGNSNITGGWNGSKSMSYTYSSTPTMTYTTKNAFSFDNVKSAIVNANFGYYADAGKQEACKLTINILKNGSIVKTAYKDYSMTGFGSGTANISASVDTTSLVGNCQVQLIMSVTKADGSHVSSTSSFTSCYLNT